MSDTKRDPKGFQIGWAQTDLTPDRPVLVSGQFHARVSEGVMDPVTATALALDAGPAGRVVMVSCDIVAIPDGLRDAVRERLRERVPELDPTDVFLNATHTHAAPEVRVEGDLRATGGGNTPTRYGLTFEEMGVMDPADYAGFAVERIAEAAAEAWSRRAPGGIGFGLGQAVVGRNRRIAYYGGEAKMYGKTDVAEFSHVEGYEDHDVNLLCTVDSDGKLTGLVVNLACPSQVSEQSYLLSADYWHDVRVELRKRLGADLFVLAQNSASGDQSPHILLNRRAEARMLRLKGLADAEPEIPDGNLGNPEALRRSIALRVADTVSANLPAILRETDSSPAFAHCTDTVELARRDLSQSDVDEALAEAEPWRAKFEALRRQLDERPEKKSEPRWYIEMTRAYRRMKWYEAVAERFEMQKRQPRLPIEVHTVRLGQVAWATNPFEFYIDFGTQIKARSPAVQTFLVQHVGSGTYLPSLRAVAGKSYGAVPASTPVGPEGGRELVEHTLNRLQTLFA